MIEDGIQEVWRRVGGGGNGASSSVERAKAGSNKEDIPLWQRVVGFFWVATWLCMTTPWYLYPINRLPTETQWMVPVNVAEKIGLLTAQAVVVVSGLLLMFALRGEI